MSSTTEVLHGGILLTPSSSSAEFQSKAPAGTCTTEAMEDPRDDGNHDHDFATDNDTSSAFSTTDLSSNGPYQVIEYDVDGDLVTDTLSELRTLTIEDDSPAAEAIRANANVRVSTVGKAARAVHMQAVRRFVKKATGATKSGVVRGKPPRIPERGGSGSGSGDSSHSSTAAADALRCSVGGNLETVPEEPESDRAKPISNLTFGSDMPEDGHLPDSVVAGTVEASKKVLRAVDPHDLLKLLRWKRKKKAERHKLTKSYVKGKVIDGEHELYTLSIAVMIGVRTSILQTNMEINNGKERRWVKATDFRTTEKYEFRPKGGGLTPPHQLSHTFKFKDYSPVAFAYLRRLAGVNEFDFLLSVCGNANFIEFISNAKSGQFFFYSGDGRFMIKTMTNAESKFLRRVLPDYFRHCVENPNTLITRFFGMYRVKLYHLRRNVKFVIMNSVYYTYKYLQTFYDLKGSSIGRDAKPGQSVRKDNDLRRGMPDEALSLPPTTRSRLRQQLNDDCGFLQSVGVMDYSMLVGVHHVPHTDDQSIATSGFKGNRGVRSRNNKIARHDDDSMEEMHDVDNSASPGQGLAPKSGSLSPSPASPDDVALQPVGDPSHRQSHSDNAGIVGIEDLDEDDCSYLAGAEGRPVLLCAPLDAESERKKQVTVEKLYWPFHRLYDIHGHRRLHPMVCPLCSQCPCECHSKEDAQILQGYNIPKFVPPLSNRKDGGLEMDTSGRDLPMVFKGPKGAQLFGSKIFYMGVIDVLQEYTSRKALEAQYRYMQTHGRPEASCVPPSDYADRFLHFFDEFTQPMVAAHTKEEGIELSERGEVLARQSHETN